jgi:transcriptional regulator with XRE-family HTH domain
MEGSQHKEHRDRWQNRSIPLPHLRETRRSRGWSQRELSERANVSPTTVRLLETEKRGSYPLTLRKLAAALGVSPAVLMQEHHPEREDYASK